MTRRPTKNLDPALLPEAHMDRMREEMWRLRRTVISLLPETYREAVDPPHDLSREESNRWREIAAQRVIEVTVPDEMGKAACPLCGAVPQFVQLSSWSRTTSRRLTSLGNLRCHPCRSGPSAGSPQREVAR